MRIAALLLSSVLIAACGQKGPLVIPEPPAQSEPDEEDEPSADEDRRGP